MSTADFLFEIQCEELPPKALNNLRSSLENSVKEQLTQLQLSYNNIKSFATPRRLALLILDMQTKQADQTIQKRGPAMNQAYDADSNPSKACLGFLKSCNADVKDLKVLKTDQGEWVYCEQHIPGKATRELIPEIMRNAVKALPIPKWMHWGNWNERSEMFARPVHHIVLMCNNDVIDATILGLKSGNVTMGHRFLCKRPIKIAHVKDYEDILEQQGWVIVDFDKRRENIHAQIKKKAFEEKLTAIIEDTLLTEVTAIVEWPTAQLATFDKRFLAIPKEALISAMQEHQKSFPLLDITNELTNKFIFVSNINPDDTREMIGGNEKVMAARLSDAKFFYETDLKTPLKNLVEKLKTVTFQDKLGTLHDKALRLEKLCDLISNHHPHAKRAGLLAKTDLLTNMVCEFTELQGTMGYYYATHDGENEEVAIAMKEQYLPRFMEDDIAKFPLGCSLSIADKIDTLVGSFGINQIPTGSKDPFGLRRAAIGIIRTITESNSTGIDLKNLIQFTLNSYQVALPNKNTENDLLQFFNDRLRVWLKDKGFDFDAIDAVLSLNLTDLLDCRDRINAVTEFKKLPEAESLAAANKRVANILQKNTELLSQHVNDKLFEKTAETTLYNAILEQEKKPFHNYTTTLEQLAALRPSIDCFFDKVMVNAEDEKIRLNRLSLLARLRALFLKVADIAHLQKL